MSVYGILRRLYSSISGVKRRRYLHSLVSKGLILGKNVEIIADFFFDPSHCFLISIGDNCTICPNVRLIAHDASTKRHLGYTKIGRIDIRDNCFIGDSVVVLPGVTIGPDAVVGAGSVVTGDVPAQTVVAGNPARVISALGEYLEKVAAACRDKRVFDETYFIEHLDAAKRREILSSVTGSTGFIV